MESKDFKWIRIVLWIIILFCFAFFILIHNSNGPFGELLFFGVLTITCIVLNSTISKRTIANKFLYVIGVTFMGGYGFSIFEGIRTNYLLSNFISDLVMFLTFLTVFIIGKSGIEE